MAQAADVASGGRAEDMGRSDAAGWLLARPGPVPDSKIAFVSARRLLLLAVCSEAWFATQVGAYQALGQTHLAVCFTLTACLAAGWLSWQGTRAAVGLALAVALVDGALAFPSNANHQILMWLGLVFVAVADEGRSGDREAAVQGLRWLVVLAFFWAGVQKVIYGYYLGGEFLAFRVSFDPDFASIFRVLLPDSEATRLLSMAPGPGAGPYRADAPLFVLASNLTWIAEIVIALCLLHSKTRRFAVVAGIAFVMLIELGAKEVFFGVLMINLFLLCWSGRAMSRLLPVTVAVYGWLVLAAAGVLPRWGAS